jgi:hypothetical protein
MKLSIILSTLLSNFATNTPNLCDIVYTDAAGSPYTDSAGRSLARYCEWTGPDAPVWDADVCCDIDEDGAACTVPDAVGRCRVGERYFCEYGAALSSGVVCYQPFPSMCDEGLCLEAPDVPPPGQAILACCGAGGGCQLLPEELILSCHENGGTFLSCENGIENANGTVDCWD